MKILTNLAWKFRLWQDTKGQDLIEYALMAGFVAVAAGAIMPGVANSISTVFSNIASVMTSAANQVAESLNWFRKRLRNFAFNCLSGEDPALRK